MTEIRFQYQAGASAYSLDELTWYDPDGQYLGYAATNSYAGQANATITLYITVSEIPPP
ncbi:MAG: hypothetical protein ACREJQ_03120 [bacterium]